MTERILPIADFPGYFVSDQGAVYSAWEGSGRGVRIGGGLRPLRLINCGDGRLRVGLNRDGRKALFRVHVLVLTAFRGPRPPGMGGCHFPDRDPKNNALSNLRWDTPAGNQADRKMHGTANSGERNGGAKLTAAQVAQIRESAESRVDLSARFGVSPTAISMIATGKTWRRANGF